ncbi:hypothetical protein [Neolewinella antarctica]|uniref:Protein BatD n=1 Tax=Neolewinella antarctica TaxID=442734 RepID=A0ABX0XDT7_9BACT|nr:hypothetical protein [Neolewinella antarctica]NJC27059.1 hypothetical protein [Neolewinella antarctica]
MRASLFTLLFFASQLALPAQQSTNERVLARAELASKDIEIGDQIFLKVNLSAPPGTEIGALEPTYLNTLTGIELVEGKALNVVAETPERLLEQRFLITSFDTGYIAIAPLPYVYQLADGTRDTTYTNDLLLHVSAYPVTDDSELQPIKPIIEEPRNWLDFWPLYLIILLGAAGYAAYVIAKNRKRIAPPPPPPPPADLQALNALKELDGKQLWQKDETKTYYTELTDILRTYLQDQFGIQAREMTSRQTAAALKKSVGMKPNLLTELSELLQLSDLVKFAQATPAEELHPRSLERVRKFVRATAEKEATVPEMVKPTSTEAPTSTSDIVDGPGGTVIVETKIDQEVKSQKTPLPPPDIASRQSTGLADGQPATAPNPEKNNEVKAPTELPDQETKPPTDQ